MSSFKDKFLNRSLELGMSVVQRALGHPTVGPLVMKSLSQGLQLRETLEQTREQVLQRMQVASSQEQEQLQDQVSMLERKLERLERRLRQLNAQARAAEAEAAALEAAKAADVGPETEAESAASQEGDVKE